MKKIKLHISFLILIFCATSTYAAGLFNGVAGIKMETNFAQSISFQSFLAGQFNFTPNIIMRAEASLDTPNIANKHFIDSWVGIGFNSWFKLDEVSVSFRQQFFGGSNYVGLYVGQYEPLGSDVFLRRQFNTPQLASKITDSWLGLSGSVIYPRFKAGISDVIHFANKPIALGLYTYYDTEPLNELIDKTNLSTWTNNPEEERKHGISTDFRFACAYDYFYMDAILGLQLTPGFNRADNNNDPNAKFASFLRIDEVNLQTGVTMLIGNIYTPFSLFMQTGMYSMTLNAKELIIEKSISGTTSTNWMSESFYALFEPRIKIKNFGMDISIFVLPDNTINKLFIVKGNIGANINLYGNAGYLGKANTIFGCHLSLSSNRYINSLWNNPEDLFNDFVNDCPRISVAPYMNMQIHTGEFHTMLRVNINKFINYKQKPDFNVKEAAKEAFELHIGYKAHF